MARQTESDAPRRGDVLRARALQGMAPEKRSEMVHALRQRIRGLILSMVQAGQRYYSPIEMIEFVEQETADLRAAAEGRERVEKRQPLKEIHIVMTGPPGHRAGEFVEVEDKHGRSIKVGEWVERKDGYWALVVKGRGLT